MGAIATSGTSDSRIVERRRFIRWIGMLGAATAVVAGLPAGWARANPDDSSTRTIFRLSSRGRRACKACKNHDANLYFRTPEAIRRAHQGCNCTVVRQTIPVALYNCYFRKGDVYDRRTGSAQGSSRPCETLEGSLPAA